MTSIVSSPHSSNTPDNVNWPPPNLLTTKELSHFHDELANPAANVTPGFSAPNINDE